MLYLAEVQKKTRTFGISKAEFKLLACQRAEHSWSAVGEEVIPAPDDVPYNSGALVLVDLSGSRNVQRYTDAGRQLVSILQNFSRLQEKFKTQEEEIEQWKQSLTYQSQELNRREMEMEARQEELQDLEESLEKLEHQRQEIEAAKAEIDGLQEEFERKSQELEGAWAHLNGEKRQFEERQGDAQQAAGLDAEQSRHLHELLDQFSNQLGSPAPIGECIEQANALIGQHQEVLDRYWQDLEQQRQTAQHLQSELDQGQDKAAWDEWKTLQSAWLNAQAALTSQQEILRIKREMLSTLTANLQQQDELYQMLQQLDVGVEGDSGSGRVDVAALEEMPLADLQSVVQDLKRDLEKNAQFVSSQEEELTLQQQDIESLKQRIAEASEYDRLRLETELSDEQESYRMLNETLVGQRRNVQEREAVLLAHESVLARRQGLPLPDNASTAVDLTPALTQVEQLKSKLSEDIAGIEQQIQELEGAIATQEAAIQQQGQDVEQRWTVFTQSEQEWVNKRASTAELWGKVNAHQELLQTAQDALNRLRDKVSEVTELTSQMQATHEQQANVVSTVKEAIQTLTMEEPQLAAS